CRVIEAFVDNNGPITFHPTKKPVLPGGFLEKAEKRNQEEGSKR
ncbi:unnamed protein product, partial [Heterotrigona itama]